MNFEKRLKGLSRNSIRLEIGTPAEETPGGTRFGGAPDVPEGFEWPVFTGEWSGEGKTKKERPLSFLAQFNCAELARYDTDNLLPPTGLLSFFYDVETQRWGYDPKDAGCARVFWFEDTAALHRMAPPAALREENPPYTLPDFGVFPPLKIRLKSEPSLPHAEDLLCIQELTPHDWDRFEKARAALGMRPAGQISKLLGWPDMIQGNMTTECELVSRGYYLGNIWTEVVSDTEIREAERTSFEGWRLLFQLDSLQDGAFDLMFGDCGRIYFYIRTKDLKARRFDRVWLVLQCD